MTTKRKPSYNRQGVIDYSKLSFDPDERELPWDHMYQLHVIGDTFSTLKAHIFSKYAPETVFVSAGTFVCYDRENLNVRVSPDLYVAFDVDAAEIERRKLFLPWEAGKPPDFVLEVASESTARNDVTRKREIYSRIGVPEYWRFDRSGGELYGTPLAADRLTEGAYQPVELTAQPDGVLKGHSTVLGLSLCWHEEKLLLYDHEARAYLLDQTQEQRARQAAESRIADLEDRLRRYEQPG